MKRQLFIFLALLAGSICFASITDSGIADFDVTPEGSDDWSGTLVNVTKEHLIFNPETMAVVEEVRKAIRGK